jgi:hypothetical protein
MDFVYPANLIDCGIDSLGGTSTVHLQLIKPNSPTHTEMRYVRKSLHCVCLGMHHRNPAAVPVLLLCCGSRVAQPRRRSSLAHNKIPTWLYQQQQHLLPQRSHGKEEMACTAKICISLDIFHESTTNFLTAI